MLNFSKINVLIIYLLFFFISIFSILNLQKDENKFFEKKINLEIKTTDAEVESKFVEAAAFAYLAYMERGEIFSPR